MLRLEKIATVKNRRFLLKVENSAEAADYAKYEELRNEIWGFPEDNMPGPRNMMCENFLHDGSSLFIAVYAEDQAGRIVEDKTGLVGFSYGFVGINNKAVGFKSRDNIWFYSQYTGVLPSFQGGGLGVAIKEFQREILVEVFGITIVTCTFDPLTGVNARRNIHHFGMDVHEYRTATYGAYGGHLNRLDVPSDRFFMTWDLRKKVRRREDRFEDLSEAGHGVLNVEEASVMGRSRPEPLEIVRGLRPEREGEFLLLRIPRDFYLMLRETDVDDPRVREIPVAWRMMTREAFLRLFERGYKVVDFLAPGDRLPGNCYVLAKSSDAGIGPRF